MDGYFTIYPIYLDSSRKASKGRKYNLELCIENPTYTEILLALKSLNLDFKEEPTKRHPREPFVFGRFKINKMYGKRTAVGGIANEIKELRKNVSTKKDIVEISSVGDDEKEKKAYVKNEMNLIPKKKKKNKKK